MTPAFDLQRFLDAQAGGMFERAVAELSAGGKQTHWMWFIFPQLKALGRSQTAQFYGIEGLAEARAYLAHPRLGDRLFLATEAALAAPASTLNALFGTPDDLKFVSCVTLFERAAQDPSAPFAAALSRWADGRRDARTLELLDRAA